LRVARRPTRRFGRRSIGSGRVGAEQRQRSVDRQAGVVYVRRLRQRAAQAHQDTTEALDRLPHSENEILFPNARGGRIDCRSFGRRHWKPAQRAAGIQPLRGLYDLRHTYATFALRAGIPVFAVSRFMGSSIAMIDRYYGHLAHDSRRHAVSLLDALAYERVVDAGWTSHRQSPTPLNNSGTPRRTRNRRRVDARWTPRLIVAATIEEERSR
jgi:hypothetical protein